MLGWVRLGWDGLCCAVLCWAMLSYARLCFFFMLAQCILFKASITDVWNPSSFFPHPILSTIPLLVEHDNQWQRNLLRDLGPVYRRQCSEHCLLKGWVHCPFPFYFHFIFGLIYIIISMIAPHTASHHHTYTLVSAWLTHPFHLIIILTLMCHCCLPP